MSWHEPLLRRFGPGLLGGIAFGDFIRLLAQNRFRIAPSCWQRMLTVAMVSTQNSSVRWLEKLRYARKVSNIDVPPPLFVLGHWRSGTTHLHNLLSVDERLGFPNQYQCLYPHGFLSWERFGSPPIGKFLTKERPMDNITWTMQSPQEDEFALCILSLKSLYLGWVFPQNHERYDEYLTFQNVAANEITEWKNAFVWFLKRMTWQKQRRLILKSPTHTARTQLLLELFPNAQFVHVHRNPFAVFPSFKRTLEINIQYHQLQLLSGVNVDDWVLKQYRTMYDAFFEQRKLMPPDNFYEVCFEELEQDPLGELKKLYEALNLPDFAHVEATMRSYVGFITGYKKNDYPLLPQKLRERITSDWQPSFDEWGYTRV